VRRAFAAALTLGLLAAFSGCSSEKTHSGGASGSGSDQARSGAGGKDGQSESAGAGASNSRGGSESKGGEASGAGAVANDPSALGAFPHESSPVTRGGTMTFSNIGAPGSWPRRLDRPAGDPACDYKDGTDTWGGHCCQETYQTSSDKLAPFDQEMTLIVKAISIKQLAVYQPSSARAAAWDRVTAWDQRGRSENIWFTQKGAGSAVFPGDLTKNDCVG